MRQCQTSSTTPPWTCSESRFRYTSLCPTNSLGYNSTSEIKRLKKKKKKGTIWDREKWSFSNMPREPQSQPAVTAAWLPSSVSIIYLQSAPLCSFHATHLPFIKWRMASSTAASAECRVSSSRTREWVRPLLCSIRTQKKWNRVKQFWPATPRWRLITCHVQHANNASAVLFLIEFLQMSQLLC